MQYARKNAYRRSQRVVVGYIFPIREIRWLGILQSMSIPARRRSEQLAYDISRKILAGYPGPRQMKCAYMCRKTSTFEANYQGVFGLLSMPPGP
jgi:hypothetical protein